MKFKNEMTIGPGASMNCEKRGNEPGDVGTSVSISGDVHVDALADLFTTPDIHKQVLVDLYGKNDQLIVPDIGSIALKSEFEKVNVALSGPVLEDERIKFTGGKLKDIVLTPKHGRAVGVAAKLYVYASDEQYQEIAKLLRKLVMVSITSGRLIAEKSASEKQGALTLAGGKDSKADEAGEGAPPVH